VSWCRGCAPQAAAPCLPMVPDKDCIRWPENTRMASMSAGSPTPYTPASSPRSADVVLYLDLDGVVHHKAVLWHPQRGPYMSPHQAAGHSLFEWLPLLQEELAPYPQVALVLSSSWFIRPGYAKSLLRLPEQLRNRSSVALSTSVSMAQTPGSCRAFETLRAASRF